MSSVGSVLQGKGGVIKSLVVMKKASGKIIVEEKGMGFAVLLRGVNVGGSKIIKMEELGKIFVSMGFKNSRTFIQSGNVVFQHVELDCNAHIEKIEKGLNKSLGYPVQVHIRTGVEMEEIVKLDPFKKVKPDDRSHCFVTFLSKEPTSKLKVPYLSPKKDFEILHVCKREVYSVSHPLPNGRFGNPVPFIEKELDKSATTRNWNTVVKMTGLCSGKC